MAQGGLTVHQGKSRIPRGRLTMLQGGLNLLSPRRAGERSLRGTALRRARPWSSRRCRAGSTSCQEERKEEIAELVREIEAEAAEQREKTGKEPLGRVA